jgi:hypothetical protein
MSAGTQKSCRKTPCANTIPSVLFTQHLCMEHFLDEAFVRTDETSRNCREGRRINPEELEWLLADALIIVTSLETDTEPQQSNAVQRERMLELLLVLADLHEYVARHPVRLDRPA